MKVSVVVLLCLLTVGIRGQIPIPFVPSILPAVVPIVVPPAEIPNSEAQVLADLCVHHKQLRDWWFSRLNNKIQGQVKDTLCTKEHFRLNTCSLVTEFTSLGQAVYQSSMYEGVFCGKAMNKKDNTVAQLVFPFGNLGRSAKALIDEDFRLNGTLFNKFHELPNLIQIDFSGHNISGTIPALWGHDNVVLLDLSGNKLSGSFPVPPFWMKRTLSPGPPLALFLNDNRFSGLLPRMSPLIVDVNLESNRFEGDLDRFLRPFLDGQPISRVTRIHLGNNLLAGTLPTILALFNRSLSSLSLHSNKISGTMPIQIGRLSGLEHLNVFGNRLSGTFPANSVPATSWKLNYLDISNNQFTGAIAGTDKIFNASYYNASKLAAISAYGDFSVNRFESREPVPIPKATRADKNPTVIWTIFWSPQDIDDCAEKLGDCLANSYCADGWNPPLSWTCACNQGYEKIPGADHLGPCQDIDECKTGQWKNATLSNNSKACTEQIQCLNLPGSYFCCSDGFRVPESINRPGIDPKTPPSCRDINECKEGMSESRNSSNTGFGCRQEYCVNTIGSFQCCNPKTHVANEDYTKCIQIDACAKGTHNCSSFDQCISISDGWMCCPAGTRVDRNDRKVENPMERCIDIDECTEQLSACPLGRYTCVNFYSDRACCPKGYQANSSVVFNKTTDTSVAAALASCIDINECAGALPGVEMACGSPFLCHNLIGNYSCCTAGSWNEYPMDPKSTCKACFEGDTGWVRSGRVDDEKAGYFPVLDQFMGTGKIAFDYYTCFGSCLSGSRILQRPVPIVCDPGQGLKTVNCIFPCRDQNFTDTTAMLALTILHEQLNRADFLNDVFWKIFGSNITISLSSKRAANVTLGVSFNPCPSANLSQALQILESISTDIVPNIPGFRLTTIASSSGSCNIGIHAADPPQNPLASTGNLLGLIIGVIAGVLILLLLVILMYYYFSDNLGQLPEGVAWPYKAYKRSLPMSWDFRGTSKAGYHFLELSKGSAMHDRAMKLFSLFDVSLDQQRYSIGKIMAVYNPTLVTNFIGQYRILSTRADNDTFTQKRWTQQKQDLNDRMLVSKTFQELCSKFHWNEGIKTPIIGACHGTDLGIAEKICETGFASLSSLDAGYFGKGIYFTCCSLYTIPYIAARHTPAIIVSWVLPGNSYPVIESHKGPQKLLGAAIVAGYNSHYVSTNRDGDCTPNGTYDELVVPQESQITPAFIFVIDNSNIMQLGQYWSRPLGSQAKPTPQVHQSDDGSLVSLSENEDQSYVKLLS